MKRKVARDSENKIMWIYGMTDISPLTYREFNEGRDMESGWITKDEVKYIPPYTVNEEDVFSLCLNCLFYKKANERDGYKDCFRGCPVETIEKSEEGHCGLWQWKY